MESEDGIIFMYSLLGSLNQEASLSLKVQYWNLLNVLFIVWVLHTWIYNISILPHSPELRGPLWIEDTPITISWEILGLRIHAQDKS